LFDTVRIWEFSPVWTDFDKFDNLSKRNVKLILNILSDLEPLRGSSNKKNVVFNSFVCQLGFLGTREPLKRSFHSRFKLTHSCQNVEISTNCRLVLCFWTATKASVKSDEEFAKTSNFKVNMSKRSKTFF
jgi:hypothetical protein